MHSSGAQRHRMDNHEQETCGAARAAYSTAQRRLHTWIVCLLLGCVAPVACDSGGVVEPPPREGRGATVSVTKLYEKSRAEVDAELDRLGVPATARFGVAAYRILYETIGLHDEPVTASGAVVVPGPVLGALDVMSIQHGTILRDDKAPSQDESAQFLGVVYAADGYLAVLPDLLGLGASEGVHPYHHAATAATAVVDMLRASYDFAAAEGITLSGKLFLSGYSQGGHTAMAAHRALEAEYSDEFTVTASTPMAGAYDLSGVMAEIILSTEPYPSPYYLPYLLIGYDAVYELFDSPSDYLASPYDVLIPPLFDGTHGPRAINALMPDILRDVVNPTLLAAFEQDPNHFYRRLFEENDVYRWSPKASIRMYHCSGDRHVPIDNAYTALEGLKGGSGTVELIEPVSGADHFGCAAFAVYAGKAWIDTF